MKIGIVLNPNSRYNKKHPESAEIYTALGKGRVIVYRTSCVEDVTVIARSFKAEGISFLGISGGDGTIHHVISRFMDVYGNEPMPVVLLLGDGTMNNIAHSVGLKFRGRRNLKKFLKKMMEGKLKIIERGTMKIGDKYCFLFGCGLTSNFLIEAYKGKKGYLKNVEVIHRTIKEVFRTQVLNEKKALKLLRPLDGDIYCDGLKLPLQHMLVVLAGTVEEVGMGFRPLYMAAEKKGHFHVIATDLEPHEILFRLGTIGLGKGQRIKNPQYCDKLVHELVINAPHPFEYTMDGDMYVSEGSLSITSGPDVRFAVV